jgi:hypothetical protein
MNEKKEEYCCEIMENNFIEKGSKSIEYHPVTRCYSVELENGYSRPIQFCPWCGKKFPKRLGKEWDKVVEKEFGITNHHYDHRDKLPPEFETDEWWKKRGL